MPKPLTFLKAAQKVLTDAGRAMHYRDITRIALETGLLVTQGKTPEATMSAQIAVQLQEQGDASTFVRVSPGIYGLRKWVQEGKLDLAAAEDERTAMISHYPKYDQVRQVLEIWDGAPDDAVTRMQRELWAHKGTRKDQVDWTDPDTWIDERLQGQSREWAKRTWEGTRRTVSPRYVASHWHLARTYGLLQSDDQGLLGLGAVGRDFIAEPEGETVRLIDRRQGLLRVLRLVAEAGSAGTAELFDPWLEFLLDETNIRAESTAKHLLTWRLGNLLDRGYVERDGRAYGITEKGLAYLGETGDTEDASGTSAEAEILRLQDAMRQEVRETMLSILSEMDPYAFEALIQRLLDAMGYQNTELTSQSGDGGADVLGTINVGISEIKEVVQVKRQKANVGRPVLDSLRGSLYRFDAVQGTIITTSGFTKDAKAVAFDRGAPPIALIDGTTLVKLLIEHDIGVEKRHLELWTIRPGDFVENKPD